MAKPNADAELDAWEPKADADTALDAWEPTAPAPALGRARYDQMSVTPERLAQAQQTRDEMRADVLVREGMTREEADRRVKQEYRASDIVAPGRSAVRAAEAIESGREGDNTPLDVARRMAAPAARRVTPEPATTGAKEESWREAVRREYAALASPTEWQSVVERLWSTTAETPAEDAKAAGVVKPWLDDIKNGLSSLSEALPNPVAVSHLAIDPEQREKVASSVQTVWAGIKGAASDPSVRTVFDITSPAQEEGSILQPVEPAEGATDEEIRQHAPKGVRGVLTRAAVRGLPLETASQVAAALGGDYGKAYQYEQFIRDARPDEAFDEFGAQLTEAIGDPEAENAAARALDELAPKDIPDRDVAGSFPASSWSALLKARPEFRQDKAFARVYAAIDGNEDAGRIEDALRTVKYKDLARARADVGPTLGAVRALTERRRKALLATGGDASGELEKLAAAAMTRSEMRDGRLVYVENPAAQIMRLAGTLAEGTYEADVRWQDLPGPYLYTAAIASADALGADTFARQLQELPLPTKAALDKALATGVYDDALHAFGFQGSYRPQRDDPGGWRSWLARVAANVEQPEFQGPGYRGTYLRAGGDTTGGVASALGTLDVAVDFLNPADDYALHGVTQVAGRTARAARAVRVAPEGARAASAFAAALPEVVASGKDLDAYTALNQATQAAVAKGFEEGELLEASPLLDREVQNVLGTATHEDVKARLTEVAGQRRARVINAKAKMLGAGGTPEQIALRKTPDYARVANEYEALVQAGTLTPDQAKVGLRLDEVRAFLATDAGEFPSPEGYFAAIERQVGGTSGAGAYFQVKPDASPDEVIAELNKVGIIPQRRLVAILGEGRPEYLDPVAEFIVTQRQKLRSGQLSRRDVAKAYLLTLSSIQQSEIPLTTLAAKGDVSFIKEGRDTVRYLDRDGNPGPVAVRPEDYAAAWMLSPTGKRVLDNLEAGTITPEDEAAVAAVRRIYSSNTFENAFKQPGKSEFTLRNLADATDAINATGGDPVAVEATVKRFKGIQNMKAPFIAQLLGIGDMPTLDAVDVNGLLTGKGRLPGAVGTLKGEAKRRLLLAKKVKESGSGSRAEAWMIDQWRSALDRLRAKGVAGTDDIAPEAFGAVMHHWFWDKLKGGETSHAGMYEAQKYASTIGGVETEQGTIERVARPEPVAGSGPAFRAWFKDSRVVDENGAPKVVYHGTARAGFDTFDAYGSEYGLFGQGSYFTEDPDIASSYTEKGKARMVRRGEEPSEGVYPALLSIKNPMDMDAPANIAMWREAPIVERYGADIREGMTNEQAYRAVEDAIIEQGDIPKYEAAAEIQDAIREMGHDGITHIGGGRVGDKPHRVYIAFDPEQIKSAIGNRGTFDPNDPNILHSTIGGKQTEQGTIERVRRPVAPTFYSGLRRAVEGIKQERFTAEQLRGMLAGKVKADEIEWTRLDEFLRDNPAPTKNGEWAVTIGDDPKKTRTFPKDQEARATEYAERVGGQVDYKKGVLEWLDEHAVVVEEKRLGERPDHRAYRWNGPDRTLAEVSALYDSAKAEKNWDAVDALTHVETVMRDYGYSFPDAVGAAAQQADGAARAAMEVVLGGKLDVPSEPVGPAAYQNYQLPGGTNYREVLFKVPEQPSVATLPAGWKIERESFGTDIQGETAGAEFVVYGPEGDVVARGPTDREAIRAAEEATGESLAAPTQEAAAARYQAPHFGDEGRNLLAHTRLSDRVGPNGEKILHVEEVQSDWHQAGREKGYELPAGTVVIFDKSGREVHTVGSGREAEAWIEQQPGGFDAFDYGQPAPGERTPPAPFSKTWHELVMKRVLREAAEGGYDGVSWTTGKTQADRYSLAKTADELRWVEQPGYGPLLDVIKDGKTIQSFDVKSPDDLVPIVGKDVAKRLMESPLVDGTGPRSSKNGTKWRSLSGENLQVGGAGMVAFYDRMLPEWANKYTKKWGGRVGGTTIETTGAASPTTTLDVAIRRAREGGDPNSAEALEWLHGQPIDDVRWRHMADEWGDGQAESARLWFNEAAADIKSTNGREPVHYLPLTPQMRDALLHEGQPLFQRTPTGIHGSIEPKTIGYLQRFFQTADFDTLLHEDGHLLRFLFGDRWTSDLARHFDHTVDPNGFTVLTRKGEEQAAEALRWYFRTKIQPDGKLRGLLDRVYVTMQNAWLGLRNEPGLLPRELSAMWDAQLRPSDALRPAAVAIADTEALRTIPNVTTLADPGKAIVANVPPREGKLRDFARIDAVPAETRAALGIDANTTEMDPLDLYKRALAHVVVESYKKTGWGDEALTALTRRSAVPASRAPRVIKDVADRVRHALGDAPPKIDAAGNLDWTPAQRAGVQALVNEAVTSPLGDVLPAEVRMFDHMDPSSTMSPAQWQALNDVLIDIHAGLNARRSGPAERFVTVPLFTALVRWAAQPLEHIAEDRAVVRHVNQLLDMFRVDVETAKYMKPGVREAMDETARQLGHIGEEVAAQHRALASGDRAQAYTAMRRLVADNVSAFIDPSQVDNVVEAHDWLRTNLGEFGTNGRVGGDPDATLNGMFGKDGWLDKIETTLTVNPIQGATGMLPLEQAAVTEIRRIHATKTGTWLDALADPSTYDRLTDALGILQRAADLRYTTMVKQADNIILRAAGAPDLQAIRNLAPQAKFAIYRDFWTGEWDSMFNRMVNIGQIASGPSFNQQAAVTAILTGLMADKVVSRLGERLLDLGIAADMDQALTLGATAEAAYSKAIGQHGPEGFNVLRGRVHRWINNIVGWKEAGITKLVEVPDPATGEMRLVPDPDLWEHPTGQYTQEQLASPEEREAYTLAHRYLAQLGWQYGKGTFGDLVYVFPDGRELYLPEMMWNEIAATVERTAKPGVAFAGATAEGLGSAYREMSSAVRRGLDAPATYLGLAGAGNEPGKVTELLPQEEAARARRRAATWAGATAGTVTGAALAGLPGAVVGGLVGRNVVPMAIDVGGALSRKMPGGVAGRLVGLTVGAATGATLGAIKTAVDGLRVAFPMTMALGRVGMTAGLVVFHPAFFVGNAFGAMFQTYMRSGVKGVTGAFGALLSEPTTVAHMMASMAGEWGTRAEKILPVGKPIVTRTGAIWTPEMLIDAAKQYGLDSSYVKAESAGALVDELMRNTGTWTDRLIDRPIETLMGPVRTWQNAIMEAATAIDNANRVGVFLDNLKKGIEPHAAAGIARDAAFDYGKLTEFERTVMRNTVLFYSYMRQSIDLFWWTMVNNPSRVLGILRATRGQRYDEIEEPWLTAPESMDSRLMWSFQQALVDGHARQGVAMVTPRIPLDMIPLWADTLGAWEGDEDASRKLAARLTPLAQYGLVKTTGMDLWSGSSVNDYNEVPEWWVESWRNVSGSLMDDLLDIQPLQRRDPGSEPYAGAPRYQAGNGEMWWVFKNLMQIPGFGRSISTLTAADRANLGGGRGPVQAMVDWTRDYRTAGGRSDMDAFFTGPAREVVRALLQSDAAPALSAEPRTYPVGTTPDLNPPRAWAGEDAEMWALLGAPPVSVPTYETAADRLYADQLRILNEQVGNEKAAREGRYGR